MAPKAGERLARRRLRLSNLVFVVREDQIDPSTVNVEGVAEQIERHCRALEVPPRSAASPWGIPGSLRLLVLRLCRLPQREVLRILLRVIVLCDARARTHLAAVEPRKPPIR